MTLKVGEKFKAQVKSLSFKGLGVVNHPEGLVFFVPGTWPGDEGIFEIHKLEKKYGFATLTELTQKSTSRREAPCPHLGFEVGKCGGCPWMIADYPSQLKEKESLLKTQLERSKLITNFDILKPIQGSPEEFSYRNRAQFKTDGEKIGFISPGTNTFAEIENCLVLTSKNQQSLSYLKSQLPKKDWMLDSHADWNYLEIDEDVQARSLSINKKRPFKQGNSKQNSYMKSWVKGIVNEWEKDDEVLELFCGSGNFTEVLVKAGFHRITAVEGSKDAIQTLNEKKYLTVKTHAFNLFNPKTWGDLKKTSNPKILFLDPPREGFEDLFEFVKKFAALEKIIYVSCDPNTWMRDCKKMKELGFELDLIQPLDQFPQTPHLEVLSVLIKK